MAPADVARKILELLPVNKYGNIVTVLHQTDLSTATPSGVLGKINAHEMYMNIKPEEGTSKKKDIALKASSFKEKKSTPKKIIVVDNKEEEEEEEEESDEEVALLVRKVTSALSRLDKKGIKYSSSKKKFFPSKKKLEEMECYKCGKVGHLSFQCRASSKKKKEKKHHKNDSSDESSEDDKKNKKKEKKQFKKKLFKKKGRAYIGEWMTDEDTSSNSSSDASDDEEEAFAGLAIASISTPTPASSTSTSTPHLCLMAKGDKVKTFDDSSDQDDDDLPSYDELASLVQEQNKAISKLSGKLENVRSEKKKVLSKCNELEASQDQGKSDKLQKKIKNLEE